MARKASETVQSSFRIKEGLRHQIEQAGRKRGVSFNAEISMRLKESFDQEVLRTLTTASRNVVSDLQRIRHITHNADLFDRLVTVTEALLQPHTAAVVDEAKILLGIIAHQRRTAINIKGEDT
jgi:Arc-like DNA binding domain